MLRWKKIEAEERKKREEEEKQRMKEREEELKEYSPLVQSPPKKNLFVFVLFLYSLFFSFLNLIF